MRAGDMARLAAASERARSLFEQATALYESIGDTHAAARASSSLAGALQILGLFQEAIERMERAHAVIAEDEPDADLAVLLTRLGAIHAVVGDNAQALEWIERGLDVAEAVEVPEALVRGWNIKASLAAPRRPAEARGLFQLGLQTALEHEMHTAASQLYNNLSDLGFQRNRYAESLDHLEQAVALARRIGDRRFEWFSLGEMTYALTMLGRWDEALARRREIPDDKLSENNISSVLSGPLELHLHRGELDAARELLAAAEDHERSGDVQQEGCYEAAAAALRLAEGNPRDALVVADRAFERRALFGFGFQGVQLGFLHALEAALGLHEEAKADKLLAIVEQQPHGLRPPFLAAVTHRFRARLAGDDPAADGSFTAAAAQLRALELPFYLAVVLLEHGEWLAARGRPDDAAPLLAEARETFDLLGAAPWLERAKESLPSGDPEPVVA